MKTFCFISRSVVKFLDLFGSENCKMKISKLLLVIGILYSWVSPTLDRDCICQVIGIEFLMTHLAGDGSENDCALDDGTDGVQLHVSCHGDEPSRLSVVLSVLQIKAL